LTWASWRRWRFPGFDGGLLLGGIDLHQGRAVGNLFAGVDEDLCNDAFDLRHDHGGVADFR